MSFRSIRFLLAFTMGGMWSASLLSQAPGYPFLPQDYDFIRYDSNRYVFPGDSSAWIEFMAGFSRLVNFGEGQLCIVHIGGSHIQADIYPDRIRGRLQTFQPGSNAGRGMIFPYSVARTNNPSNYRVEYSGRWTTCRNTRNEEGCVLGLTGISVSTRDTSAVIRIGFPETNGISYDFNRVRVFFLDDSLSYACRIHAGPRIISVDREGEGILTWRLEGYSDSLELGLEKTGNHQQRFTLFGISLETDDPGLIYHSIGVNGAKIPSFLGCKLLPGQLAALSPDLVILSLGTNDANTRYFSPQTYKSNYDSLIREILTAVPGTAILLTVPNDSYLYRRYVNRNTALERDMIMQLAREHGCGVWDFYTVMGGLNSIPAWQHFGLAKRDGIHFTRKGYLLRGDLFFDAFLRSYDAYMDRLNQTGSLH